MRGYKLEICCGSAEDVILAEKYGADRAELNSALPLGGLTPTVGTLKIAKRHTRIPIMCMIRPRQSGFCYSETEFVAAMDDAEELLSNGSDGLAFGFLTAERELDLERTRSMARLAGDREKVFHRAVDIVPDWKRLLAQLIELGFTRVLTSGQAASVPEGVSVIRQMIEFAQGAIEILPGGGVRPENAEQIIAMTGCDQLHASCSRLRADPSMPEDSLIRFGGTSVIPENSFKTVDPLLVSAFKG